MKRLFAMDELTEDNKLFCDNCNEKTDTLKGQRIQKLPPVLTFGLARFDIDYQRWERFKVNDRFEYPLELDISEYLDPESLETPENCHYELKSIIIHRGGAHGGHYHAYI
jgi:ubiquitin carboxyl-terminal hydrolase 40